MDETRIKEICNDANEVFIAESLSAYPKFKFLPSWLKSKSFYLKSERSNPNSNYKVYNRGAIVYVDFGVNVGYELSGNHFAVVMNNKDNCKNGVVTVIPISSKEKRSYISVGKVIEIQSIKHFASHSDKLGTDFSCLLRALIYKDIVTEEQFEKMNNGWSKLLNRYPKITGEVALARVEQWGLDLEDYDKILQKLESIFADLEAYRKVFIAYQKYTKESYVMPLNIQSISKYRIKKINKFDPSSRIKAPADVMLNIDSSIIKSFTK
ncbi:MAG: type II toxin-antitoxin system PemK/MazF family toxin [Carnobacterium sp.]|uniref:type II toxin-antitoxin system PemK/MazF family toxin n=1 Tax=Carnobacterium sp. TaxID=48221 RepID=UPI003C793E6C